jgi:hypothetical protein
MLTESILKRYVAVESKGDFPLCSRKWRAIEPAIFSKPCAKRLFVYRRRRRIISGTSAEPNRNKAGGTGTEVAATPLSARLSTFQVLLMLNGPDAAK